jgi:hypothetical protein
MKKLVLGIGINDADYMVQNIVNGKKLYCHFHATWSSMLKRCYSKSFQERRPTYKGCSVCDEWLTFSNFKKWMKNQDYEGKQLDKDIIFSGNKEYSPISCVFVHRNLNMILCDAAAKRGSYPIGASWCGRNGKFLSQIVSSGKRKHLGYFETYFHAHQAWQHAKKELIYSAAFEQEDEQVKNALLSRCTQLQHDIDNGLETIKL